MSFVVTIIADPVTHALDHSFANSISALSDVETVTFLGEAAALEARLSTDAKQTVIEDQLTNLIGERPIDFAIQPFENRKKQCLIADMDSTMIDQECIDELAAEIGVKEKVASITAKAMNGEIEFNAALTERVALLEGLSIDIVDTVIENRITLAKGGKQLLQTMKANGAHTALVSGGFTLFTQKIAAMLGFDEHHANVLLHENDKLTGKVQAPILGAEAKVENLLRIAEAKQLQPKDFIAVGDGANDLPMLKMAGTGVALHAKPSVAAAADIKINFGDLTSLLYLQGYSQSQFSSGS